MTWPFENDTGAIVKKLAKRSIASDPEKAESVESSLQEIVSGSGRTVSCAPLALPGSSCAG